MRVGRTRHCACNRATLWHPHRISRRGMPMSKSIFTFTLFCAALLKPGTSVALVITSVNDAPTASSAQPTPVIEWNQTLLKIVRTPGAQPPTIHSTRSFAMLHIAIFEAVNSIDHSFEPYSDHMPRASHRASMQAAADQSAHDVLIALYPSFATHSTPNFSRI